MYNTDKQLQSLTSIERQNNHYLLQNKLISPQPYFICRPLSLMASELRQSLLYSSQQNHSEVAEIFNRTIMVMIHSQQFAMARELCYTQIDLYIRESSRINKMDLLKFIFQPWLHLIRIHGINDNYHEAIQQLNVLNLTFPVSVFNGENKLLQEKIYQSLNQDDGLRKSIITQTMLERIRLYLRAHRYAELLNYLEEEQKRFALTQEGFIQEARAIAYANTADIKKAMNLFAYKPALKLRELEMRLSLQEDHVKTRLQKLYEYYFSVFNPSIITCQHIIHMLHAALLMQKASLYKQATDLTHDCLDAAIKIGDEVLQAECLVLLQEMATNETQKQALHNNMRTLFQQSEYKIVQDKIKFYFNDLEKKPVAAFATETARLFEDLLAFDFHSAA